MLTFTHPSRISTAGRVAATLAGAGALALALVTAPPVAGAQTATNTTSFDITCRISPNRLADPMDQTQTGSVNITAPQTVAPGEVFSVDFAIDGVTLPNSFSAGPVSASVRELSRIKLDLDVPDNAEYVGAQVVNVGSFGAGVAPSVIRVDAAGNPSDTGDYLRLSGGNQTIGNGPNSSKSSTGGMTVRPSSGAETTLSFPTLRLTLRAGEPGVIQPTLRTDGAAANYGNDASFLTLLPRVNAPLVGDIWAPTACQPRDSATSGLNSGAGPLTTVTVAEPEPADPGSIVTVLEGPDSVGVDERASFAANIGVAGEGGDTEPIDGGTVQFYSDGRPVGEPRPVVRGIARLDLIYPAAGTKLVTAEYRDAEGQLAPISNTHLLTVIGPDPVDPEEPEDPTPVDPDEPATGSLGSGSVDAGSLDGSTSAARLNIQLGSAGS
ncbi:Ig-like domain-containing protein [Dietzia maris]|uniref:Ig-like domain-containing protein n=1 Tax=Dietzia maris TaxID=37915 RepID=UPI0037C7FE2F